MKTQAWGWLAAAALAAGLNASYHDGGLQDVHQVVDQVKHNATAVLALATGHADQFLAEASFASARKQAEPCPLRAALVEARVMVMPNDFAQQRIEVMSAREQARLVRLEANRARIEAEVADLHMPELASIAIRAPHVSVCPRVRVNLPRIPAVNMPSLPVVRIDASGIGSL